MRSFTVWPVTFLYSPSCSFDFDGGDASFAEYASALPTLLVDE